MLKNGTKIVIGNKKAQIYSYTYAAGKIGTIEGKPSPTTYAVSIPNYGGFWHIQEEDCLPFEIKTNKEAKILLSEEEPI